MTNNLSKKETKDSSFQKAWELMQNAAGQDILKDIGPISREEYDYYKYLKQI
ncbi:MAG: hypothetical protein Q7K16_03485 [Candidatus Azambacteria bacterium]|nr:hypothetical protein [Candidatus Azambacteria bacterium]